MTGLVELSASFPQAGGVAGIVTAACAQLERTFAASAAICVNRGPETIASSGNQHRSASLRQAIAVPIQAPATGLFGWVRLERDNAFDRTERGMVERLANVLGRSLDHGCVLPSAL